MSFDVATGAPVVVTQEDQTYSLPRLTRADCGKLLVEWAAEDRKRLIDQLDEAAVTGTDRLAELKRQDREGRLASYAYTCLFEFKRAAQVVELACTIAGPSETPNVPPDMLVEIACDLWGLELEAFKKRRSKDNDGEDGAADPTSPTKIGS